jgi:hypothetical protein
LLPCGAGRRGDREGVQPQRQDEREQVEVSISAVR